MSAANIFYARVGTVFGWQWDYPTDGQYGDHTGVDFPWAGGTPIPMFATGRVVAKGYNSTHGNWVSIIVGSTFFHFCHMEEPTELEAGDRVSLDITVGLVGETGEAYGNHLHLAASNEPYPGTGNRVDPLPLVRSYLSSSAGGNSKPFPETPELEEEEENMDLILIKIIDGQGKYGPKGKTYCAVTNLKNTWWDCGTDDVAVNPLSVRLANAPIANLSYEAWEAAKALAARGIV